MTAAAALPDRPLPDRLGGAPDGNAIPIPKPIAERAFADVGVEATYVRHPSQGGAKLFEAGMEAVFARTQKPRKR